MPSPSRPARTLLSQGGYGYVYKDAQQRTLTKESKSASKNQTLDEQIRVYQHLDRIPELRGIIPSLVGAGKHGDRSYLTMQYKKNYQDGLTVFNDMLTVLQNHATRGLAETVKKKARAIGYGVLDAISRFHAHGVAHGDVKFENFLSDENGNVILIDFGFTVFDTSTSQKKRGTVPYIPPQFTRKHVIHRDDVKAYDLWATGIILAHLALVILRAQYILAAADPVKKKKILEMSTFLQHDILRHIFPDRGLVTALPHPETFASATRLLMKVFPQYEFNVFDRDPQKRFIRRKPQSQKK